MNLPLCRAAKHTPAKPEVSAAPTLHYTVTVCG